VRWLSSARERANFISTKEENGEDQLGAWRKTTSFGLNDLEVLMNGRWRPRNGSPRTSSNAESFPLNLATVGSLVYPRSPIFQ
jgi:hypothetical protein